MFSNDTIESAAVPPAAGGARHPLMAVLGARLSARALRWGSVVLGLVLLSPALKTGLVADDYLHELMLRADPGLGHLRRGLLDLFRFADGKPESARALIEDGLFPWWVDPRARLAFFRPLTSLSHALDHWLWPSHPALMHLHSLAWYGLLIAIVGATYRELGVSRRSAALALLLFAIDDAHAPAVGWVANRNAIIALCCALPVLVVHHRQRRAASAAGVHGVWLGPLLLALALCAGEAALCVLAYLVAYAVCLDWGPWRSRFGSLLPYVLVVAGWKLCCAQLGYGVSGSGSYIDPLATPIAFARAACERFPVLVLGLFAGPFADLWELYPLIAPALSGLVLALGVLLLGVLARALWPLVRRDARLEFWGVGTLLCLLLMCATFPHDRLLLGPSVGSMMLVAVLLDAGWARRRRPLVALGVAALASVHLVAAPLLAPLRASEVGRFSQLLGATDASLPSGDGIRDKTLVLLNPPLDPFAAYLPVYREAMHVPRPRQQLWLATGASELRVYRIDAHTLALRPEGGFLTNSMQRMLRARSPGFAVGERVDLDGASVEVTDAADDGRPLQVAVHFARELGDPSLIWMRWQHDRYAPFQLPPVGASVLLPRPSIVDLLFAG